jgi:hypothetical protein
LPVNKITRIVHRPIDPILSISYCGEVFNIGIAQFI